MMTFTDEILMYCSILYAYSGQVYNAQNQLATIDFLEYKYRPQKVGLNWKYVSKYK